MEQAREVLNQATKKNRIRIHDMDSVLKELQEKITGNNTAVQQEQESDNTNDFFRGKSLLYTWTVLLFSCFVAWFTDNGFVISLRNLKASFLVSFAINSVLGFAISAANLPLLSRFTRRKPVLIVGFGLCGILFLVSSAVPQDVQWLCLSLAFLAKTVNVTNVTVILIFGNEVFPTTVRTRGVSTCLVAARIGMLSSSFVDIMSQTFGNTPLYLVFGGLSLIVALGYVFIVEPDRNYLSDTMAESKSCFEGKHTCTSTENASTIL